MVLAQRAVVRESPRHVLPLLPQPPPEPGLRVGALQDELVHSLLPPERARHDGVLLVVSEQQLQSQEVAPAHLEHLRHHEEVPIVEDAHVDGVGESVADLLEAEEERRP